MNWNTFWKYLSNIALIAIILILFIPSWRVAFQGWYQGFFMADLKLSQTEVTDVDQEVKSWILFDMDSQIHSFGEFESKPIILSFWATWCSYCRPELAEIKEIQQKYKGDLNYLSVTEETIETVEKSGLNETYDFLYFTEKVPDFFNLRSYPTLFILNSNLQVVYHHEGAGKLNTKENIDFLDRLIQNK